MFVNNAVLKIADDLVQARTQHAPPGFNFAVEFGLETNNLRGQILHALCHLASLGLRP